MYCIVVTQNVLVRWGERADAMAPLQSSTFKYFVARLVLSAANELLLVSLRSAFNKILNLALPSLRWGLISTFWMWNKSGTNDDGSFYRQRTEVYGGFMIWRMKWRFKTGIFSLVADKWTFLTKYQRSVLRLTGGIKAKMQEYRHNFFY